MSGSIITTASDLKDAVGRVMETGVFAFDTETMNSPGDDHQFRLDPRRNLVFWISVACQGFSFAVPMGHPVGKQVGTKKEPRVDVNGTTKQFTVPEWGRPPVQLEPAQVFDIMRPMFYGDTLKIGHNVKFDLESIQKYYDDVVVPPAYFDTMIAAQLLNENQHEYKLGKVVAREFNYVYDKSLAANVEKSSYKEAGRYAHLDAKYTWLLYRKFEPLLREQGLDGLYALEMDVLEVLLFMEREGALLDVKAAEALKRELGTNINQIKGELFRIAGREVNLNSPAQLQELLFGKKKDGGFGLKPKMMTKGGKDKSNPKPSTSKDALEFHIDHPFVEKYAALQVVGTLHSGFLTQWLGGEVPKQKGQRMVTETRPALLHEGRLHANFKQTGTVTGRFSCSEPNLQNIPRPGTDLATKVRGLFIAPEGHSLIVADYGQIEYIVMAHLSRDRMLVQAFNDGIDLHQYVAAMVFSKDMDDVTKAERTTAKNTNFAVAYGAGDDKVAAMSKITLEQAVAFRKNHRRMLPTLYKWTERTVMDCRRRKPPHVTTLMGRKRRLPTINSSDWFLRSEAERQAVNTVVQGSAADIIKLAMVRLHRLLDDEIRLSLSVHDELVVVCPNDRLEDGQWAMREAMLGPGIQRLLTVPMKIDMKIVTRWSEAK